MVNKGFDAAYLDQLEEDEFMSLFDTQTDMDEARYQAEQDALREARRG